MLKKKLKMTQENPVLDFHDPKDTYPNNRNRELFNCNVCKLCCSPNGHLHSHLKLHIQTHPGDQHILVTNTLSALNVGYVFQLT